MPTRRLTALLIAGAFVASLGVVAVCSGHAEPPTATPAPQSPDWWRELHQRYVARARQGGADVVFLGDSITQGWNENAIWRRHYAPRRAVNFGVGGDRTQNLLWRIDHGTLDGLDPRVVVVLIGTNNLLDDTPEEIALGIAAVVKRLRTKLPHARILLLGIFPRDDVPSRSRPSVIDVRIAAVNARSARLDDGESVRFLDIGARFREPDGSVPRKLMPDLLHLSLSGYRTWADAMEPLLWTLLTADAGKSN